ncbi:MAG: alpha/beta fold hydrolase [archaeon]|nr:alpha/beta fold hydrolase [archaeon]
MAWLCVLMVVSAEPIPSDAFYSLPEIVTSKGYPSETHHAITKDGYNLTLFRIPYGIAGPSSGTPRPPVILQHGLLDFSFTWILNMPNQSLSYVLADAGFDVWMPNNRGNKESRLPNANLNSSTPEDREWWQFSWDQMALYDVPGVIGYVTSLTGFSKVSYIGHSEGSLQMFAALVALPEVADLVSSFQAFGPVAYANHLEQTTFRKLAEDYADVLYDAVDGKLFAPLPDWIHEVGAEFCAVDPFACDSVIEWICGPHKGAFNNSRMPVVGAQEPGGTSALNMVHWGCVYSILSFSFSYFFSFSS